MQEAIASAEHSASHTAKDVASHRESRSSGHSYHSSLETTTTFPSVPVDDDVNFNIQIEVPNDSTSDAIPVSKRLGHDDDVASQSISQVKHLSKPFKY